MFIENNKITNQGGSYDGTKVKEAAYPEPTQEQFEKWAATLPTGSAALTRKAQVIYGALPNQPKSS